MNSLFALHFLLQVLFDVCVTLLNLTTQSAAPCGAARPGGDDGAAAAARRRLHGDGQKVLHADPGVRQGRQRRPLPRQHARRVLQERRGQRRRGQQQGLRRYVVVGSSWPSVHAVSVCCLKVDFESSTFYTWLL